jgi:UDP-3-O-[3-hydroxymyristoyl] glucosamine N-acyltransferase
VPIFTLHELCAKLGESYEGDGSIQVLGVAEIMAAQKGDLSFVSNPKYVGKIPHCLASALIIPKDLHTDFRPVIRAGNPYLTFTKALHLFHQDNRRISCGIHPTSQVAEDVQLGNDVTIMPHAIIEEGSIIGDRTVIYPGVYIGRRVRIANEVTLYPQVSVYDGCVIGDRSILHAGCRIGSSTVEDIISAANPVQLLSDVELGANVVISGSPLAPTRICDGVKIDNLVHIGYGATIGPHCIIVSQVTIGDDAVLQERVTVAGQVVISPRVTVGARSRIGAKSVVVDNVPEDADYWGAPAQPHRDEKRLKAHLHRLPKMFDKIRSLEEKLSEQK